MANKIKHNWQLSRPEAASLLRNLADTLEQEDDEVHGYNISLAELIKFKIKINLGPDDSLTVKFTGKGAKICPEGGFCETCETCEKYSTLKKRMKIYFKALQESITRSELPSCEIVSVFLADSARMTSYTGYGDEYYAEYNALCARLNHAFEAEDMPALVLVMHELTRAMKTCHDRYK